MFTKQILEQAIHDSDLALLEEIVANAPELFNLDDRDDIARLVNIAIKNHSLLSLEWMQSKGVVFTNLYDEYGDPALVTTCKNFSPLSSYYAVFAFILKNCAAEINTPNLFTGLTPLGALVRYGAYPKCKTAIDKLFEFNVDPESISGLAFCLLNSHEEEFTLYAKIIIDSIAVDYRGNCMIRNKLLEIAKRVPSLCSDPCARNIPNKVFLLSKLSAFFEQNQPMQDSAANVNYVCTRLLHSINFKDLKEDRSIAILTQLFIFGLHKQDQNLIKAVYKLIYTRNIANRLSFVLAVLNQVDLNRTQLEYLLKLLPGQHLKHLNGNDLAKLYTALFFEHYFDACELIEQIVHEDVLVYAEGFIAAMDTRIILRRPDQVQLASQFAAKIDLICGEFERQIIEETNSLLGRHASPEARREVRMEDYDADDSDNDTKTAISINTVSAKLRTI